MIDKIDRISIQVGLSGYSFKLQADDELTSSGWMGAESIFSSKELQRRYSDVEISVFTPKCALVPAQFHTLEVSKQMLADVVDIAEDDSVSYVPVPQFAAVLLYSDSLSGTLPKIISETVVKTDGTKSRPLPEVYYMLQDLINIKDYNKIMAAYMDGCLYLVIAQGKSLLLCNTFKASDFTTAEYYIFLAMKKLQLNPEMSTIYFRTPLGEDSIMSLYRYFRDVEFV